MTHSNQKKSLAGLALCTLLAVTGCGSTDDVAPFVNQGSNNPVTPVPVASLRTFFFVATNNATNGIQVFSVDPAGNVSAAPVLTRTVTNAGVNQAPLGLAVSPDKRFLVATTAVGLTSFAISGSGAAISLTQVNANAVPASSGTPQGSIIIEDGSAAGAFGDSNNNIEGFTLSPAGAITVSATRGTSFVTQSSLGITNVGGNDIVVGLAGGSVIAFTLNSATGAVTDQSAGTNLNSNFFAGSTAVAALGNSLVIGNNGNAIAVQIIGANNALTGGGNDVITTGTQPNGVAALQLAGLNVGTGLAATNNAAGANVQLFTIAGNAPTLSVQATSGVAAAALSVVAAARTLANGSNPSALVVVTNAAATNNVTPFQTDGFSTLSGAGLSSGTATSISTITSNNSALADFLF
ncbi:hypothetical protein IV102_17145 [bacterium]|nr:hypothetical protein [bacterium]